jgi:hypothetical protein
VWPRSGVDVVERLQPLDPGVAVPELSTSLGVVEVLEERLRVRRRESERA